MSKKIKIIFFIIGAIILFYIVSREPKTEDVINETINKDLSIGYKKIVQRERVSNSRIHIRFIPLKSNAFQIDESLYRNEWTDLLETNDTLEKIAHSNKCTLYKSNGVVIRFNYVDYSDEIKEGIEKKLGKNLDEWSPKDIGYWEKGVKKK